MVSKERIDRPKLCFRVIRPRIIFHHVRDQFYFVSFHFNPFFFSFHFPSSFFFCVSLLAPLLSFCSLLFFQWCELNTFGTPFFTFAFQHQAFGRLSLKEDFSLPLPLSVEGEPWAEYRKKFIRLKMGDYG